MPLTCCVSGCKFRSHDKFGKKVMGLSFYRIPAAKKTGEKFYAELTTQRRRAWLAAISRPELNFDSVTTAKRVCSRHFYSGKPASEMLPADPDWVPSLFLGPSSYSARETNLGRFQRKMARVVKKRLQACKNATLPMNLAICTKPGPGKGTAELNSKKVSSREILEKARLVIRQRTLMELESEQAQATTPSAGPFEDSYLDEHAVPPLLDSTHHLSKEVAVSQRFQLDIRQGLQSAVLQNAALQGLLVDVRQGFQGAIRQGLQGAIRQELLEVVQRELQGAVGQKWKEAIRQQLLESIHEGLQETIQLELQGAVQQGLRGAIQEEIQSAIQQELQGSIQQELQEAIQHEFQGNMQQKLQEAIQYELRGLILHDTVLLGLQGAMQQGLQGAIHQELQGAIQQGLQGAIQQQLQGAIRQELQGVTGKEMTSDIENVSQGQESKDDSEQELPEASQPEMQGNIEQNAGGGRYPLKGVINSLYDVSTGDVITPSLKEEICCVSDCHAFTKDHPPQPGSAPKIFFNFPREEDRCEMWLQKCGKAHLVGKSSTWLHFKGYKVCGDHFQDHCFLGSDRSTGLLCPHAVPTLFIKYKKKYSSRKKKEKEAAATSAEPMPEIRLEMDYAEEPALRSTASLSESGRDIKVEMVDTESVPEKVHMECIESDTEPANVKKETTEARNEHCPSELWNSELGDIVQSIKAEPVYFEEMFAGGDSKNSTSSDLSDIPSSVVDGHSDKEMSIDLNVKEEPVDIDEEQM